MNYLHRISRIVRNKQWLLLAAAALLAGPVLLNAGAPPLLAQTVYRVDTDGGAPVDTGDAHRAYLGVQLEEEVGHGEGGARVTRVVDDSPADRAGLRKGDIIVGFEDKTIRGPVALTRQIHAAEPGDKSTLHIIRDGKRSRVDVEFGERKSLWRVGEGNAPFGSIFDGRGLTATIECDDEDDDCTSVFTLGDCEGGDCGRSLFWVGGRPVLGVELVEVTDELREHLGGSRGAGVLVSKIVSGTPAERAGIQVGDLIVSVAGDPVKNTQGLRRALRDKRGRTFQVEVIRSRRSQSIEVSIPALDDDRPTGPRAHFVPPRPIHGVPRAQRAPRAPRAPRTPARPSAVAAPGVVALPAPSSAPSATPARRPTAPRVAPLPPRPPLPPKPPVAPAPQVPWAELGDAVI